jgi:hypothetical protein
MRCHLATLWGFDHDHLEMQTPGVLSSFAGEQKLQNILCPSGNIRYEFD